MVTTTGENLTLEQLRSRLEDEKADELKKAQERIDKRFARQAEKLDEQAQDEAMKAKGVEFATAIIDTVKDVIPTLGIVVPEKGMTWTLKIEPDSTGALIVNLTRPERKASTSTGTRAPRGTGSANSITSIEGLTGFQMNGETFKNSSQMLKKLDVPWGTDAPTRYIIRWARENMVMANLVSAIVNEQPMPLGDLVAEKFPKTEEKAAVAAK